MLPGSFVGLWGVGNSQSLYKYIYIDFFYIYVGVYMSRPTSTSSSPVGISSHSSVAGSKLRNQPDWRGGVGSQRSHRRTRRSFLGENRKTEKQKDRKGERGSGSGSKSGSFVWSRNLRALQPRGSHSGVSSVVPVSALAGKRGRARAAASRSDSGRCSVVPVPAGPQQARRARARARASLTHGFK